MPELMDLAVASALRQVVSRGDLDCAEPGEPSLTSRRCRWSASRTSPPLLDRVWELRDNVTPYDAAYVALAETLGVPLVTGDVRLTRAPGTRCAIEVLA